MATIRLTLNVLPGNRIIVPGTEPSTTVTSTILEAEIRKLGISVPSIILLRDAQALIPGSRIEVLENCGAPVQKLFVLPERDQSCPCAEQIDYYNILRQNSRPPTDDELQDYLQQECGVLDNFDTLYGG